MIGSEFQSHVTPPEGFQALVIGSFRNVGDSVLYHSLLWWQARNLFLCYLPAKAIFRPSDATHL
jgi:hypothetical protein